MAEEQQLQSAPKRAGQYYVMDKIAQGGMAEIFKGLSYDLHGLKRTVCIKKILPHVAASREFISSLIEEAKIAVTLSHGNIAQTYDLGKVGDDYFIVMEYVDGKSLSQIAKKAAKQGEKIPLPIICYMIAEIASGLDYIHRRTDPQGRPLHIVHRDISPQNIIASYAGTVKIIDFGIAIAAGRAEITDIGILKGKFSYMSPEQARGDSIDHRSDIFSLGIILHELLTGKRLFKADDNRLTLRNVRRAQVIPPSSINPAVPADIDDICLRALARDRRRRFSFASDFRDELVKYLHASFPDFKTSDAALYLQELFRHEMQENSQREPQAETPHLIIEGTHSALGKPKEHETTNIAENPLDMKEFLLDELADDAQGGDQGIQEEKAEPPDESSLTTPKPNPEKRWSFTLRRGICAALSLFAIAAAALIFLKQNPLADLDVPPLARPETIVAAEQAEAAPPKIQAPANAAIHLTSTPSGATIYIDEIETALRTPATLAEMAPGNHVLGLFSENYQFWKKTVNARAGDKLFFDVQLAKNFGSLVVTSEPAGSLVVINGEPAGETPLLRENLEPGKIYRIEIWSEGYAHEMRSVRIPAGRREEVRVVLHKQ